MRAAAADFRAEVARRQMTIYKLAAVVDVWPGRLGQMLNGRIPMPDDVARRLTSAFRQHDIRVGNDSGDRRQEDGEETACHG